jgi:hypothetical protein
MTEMMITTNTAAAVTKRIITADHAKTKTKTTTPTKKKKKKAI